MFPSETFEIFLGLRMGHDWVDYGRNLNEPNLNLTQPNLSQLNHDPCVGLKKFQMFPKETFEIFLFFHLTSSKHYELQTLKAAT